jgi:hypothetical protein
MRTLERKNYVILLSGIAVAAVLITQSLLGFIQIGYQQLQQQQTARAATTVTTKTTNDLSNATNKVTVQ